MEAWEIRIAVQAIAGLEAIAVQAIAVQAIAVQAIAGLELVSAE